MDCAARERTFLNWPKRHLFGDDCRKFAEAGWLYRREDLNPQSDKLYCQFCPLATGGWQAWDNPFTEHARLSHRCIHLWAVKGRKWMNGHVPSPDMQTAGVGGNVLQPLIGDGGDVRFDKQCDVITQSVGLNYTTPNGYTISAPTHPQFTRMDTRRESIKQLRRRNPGVRIFCRDPGPYAKAGFCVPDGENQLKCYYCNLAVDDFDLEDDPLVKHAERSRNCFHIITERGEGFVDYHYGGRFPGGNETSVQEENIEVNENGRFQNCRRCGHLGVNSKFMVCKKCTAHTCCTEDCIEMECCSVAMGTCKFCWTTERLSYFVCCLRCRGTVCPTVPCKQRMCCGNGIP